MKTDIFGIVEKYCHAIHINEMIIYNKKCKNKILFKELIDYNYLFAKNLVLTDNQFTDFLKSQL